MSTASPESLHPFIFVGCWNRRGAPRNAVADAVMKTDIANVILGGDNVYPLPGTKSHAAEVFREGMELYAGKRLFGVLGNHNVKNISVGAEELAYKGWTLPAPYYVHRFKDAAIVCLDTNSMDGTLDVNVMAAWMRKTLAELKAEGLPYYIVQHEPYASYKKSKLTTLVNGSTLLYEMLEYPPVAILCADTHNFQVGMLNVRGTKILQFIVGTGGAAHDPISVPTDAPIKIADDIQLEFVNHIPGFGFLVCERLASRRFEHVADWSLEATSGGRRRKTRRLRGRSRR
jgi:hypothetical protein